MECRVIKTNWLMMCARFAAFFFEDFIFRKRGASLNSVTLPGSSIGFGVAPLSSNRETACFYLLESKKPERIKANSI